MVDPKVSPEYMHAEKASSPCVRLSPPKKDTHSRVQFEAAPCLHSRPNSVESSVVETIPARATLRGNTPITLASTLRQRYSDSSHPIKDAGSSRVGHTLIGKEEEIKTFEICLSNRAKPRHHPVIHLWEAGDSGYRK